MAGNSLIGLLKVDGERFTEVGKSGDLFKNTAQQSYQQILAEKNRLIALYREASGFVPEHLQRLRDEIYAHKRSSQQVLNQLLLKEFERLKIQFEQATWDDAKDKEGKPKKRPVTVVDIEALQPFHWGYEFDEVLQRGGFDAIITNPPWEIFKPQAKEFFAEFSEIVTKNKMTIKEFEKEQGKLLNNTEIREAWLSYQSRFPFVSQYFRGSSQYGHQTAVVNGKKTGSDVNLYKLFVEQCVNLLRAGGQCGMVIPSGIYTDLGATGLRTLLFDQTQVTGLFGFENRKAIFEGVDSRFKFIVLTLTKGSQTERFPAAFMRHEVKELQDFPQTGALWLTTALIRKLSPDSHSVMEFKSERDIAIAEKMLKFPLLGEKLAGVWNLVLTNEFHMTNDSHLFKTENAKGRLPLYEGKMIHQFNHRWGEPKYWIDEQEGRQALLGRQEDTGQILDYQGYRLGFRDVASNTNERTMIATVLPKNIYLNHKLPYAITPFNGKTNDLISSIFLSAIWNSFAFDYLIRQRVTANLTFFHIYQIPIPRLTEKDQPFKPIVTRAAQLICTTPEFDELRRELDLADLKDLPGLGLTDPQQRIQVRAELDAIIAHLYGLTKEEFRHILATFPLVKEDIKEATLLKYQKFSFWT